MVSRRRVLTTLGATTTGVAGLSETVDAHSGCPDSKWFPSGPYYDTAGNVPHDERACRESWLPFQNAPIGVRWRDEAPANLVETWKYAGSVDRNDLCYWGSSVCIYIAFVTSAGAALAGGPVVGAVSAVGSGVVCGAQRALCRMLDDLEHSENVESTDWVDVYKRDYRLFVDIPVFGSAISQKWVFLVHVEEA